MKKMKKIIRLTESDLNRIVKRVIEESKKPLMEQVVVNNVKISPTNTSSGGPLSLEYNGVKTKYKVAVNVTKLGFSVYKGGIGVVAIWKDSKGMIWAKDNTDKLFKLDQNQINKMVQAAKTKANQFTLAGVGEIKGVEGDYSATLTKIA
jgi:hypothetical protein